MHEGQKQFYDYILERTKDDKITEAKNLLEEQFNKQNEGKGSYGDLMNFNEKILGMLRPDKVEEVRSVINEFAQGKRQQE